MHAGRLDRLIEVQAVTSELDEDRVPVESWATVASVRAELVQASTEEYLRAYGATEAMAVVFRIRWRAGITTEHRVVHDGRALNIREITEIGRRRGLELRCDEVRS